MARPKGIPHTDQWRQAQAARMRGNVYSSGPKQWKIEALPQAIQKSNSWTGVMICLGLSPSGCTTTVQRWAAKLGLSTTHFTGEWQPKHKLSDEVVFCSDSKHEWMAKHRFEKRTPAVCMVCGLTNTWNGKPLQLQIDHKNGNNKDCRWENLQKVCPNCHSQTDTFCGRNHRRLRGA